MKSFRYQRQAQEIRSTDILDDLRNDLCGTIVEVFAHGLVDIRRRFLAFGNTKSGNVFEVILLVTASDWLRARHWFIGNFNRLRDAAIGKGLIVHDSVVLLYSESSRVSQGDTSEISKWSRRGELSVRYCVSRGGLLKTWLTYGSFSQDVRAERAGARDGRTINAEQFQSDSTFAAVLRVHKLLSKRGCCLRTVLKSK